jgi:hypothetical protein
MLENPHIYEKKSKPPGLLPGLIKINNESSARMTAKAGAVMAAVSTVGTGLMLLGAVARGSMAVVIIEIVLVAFIASLGLFIWFKQFRWAAALLFSLYIINLLGNFFGGMRVGNFMIGVLGAIISLVPVLVSYEALRGSMQLATYRRSRRENPVSDDIFV